MNLEHGNGLVGRILPMLAGTVQAGRRSLQAIAGRVKAYRTTAWHSVRPIKAKSLAMGASRIGYCLEREPPQHDCPAWLERLQPEDFPGLSLVYLEKTESTNTVAKQLARGGAVEGTLVMADYQEKGRGRMGKGWFALPGKSLLFSLVLKPRVVPDKIASLSLVVSLALALSLEQRGLSPRLKWPNDLLIDQKKAAGILLESAVGSNQVDWVVVGVGINLNYQPGDWPEPLVHQAVSLQQALGEPLDRTEILRDFLAAFLRLYQQWNTPQGFSGQKREYQDRMAWLGHPVEVRAETRLLQGVVVGIDETGALLLKIDGHVERVMWGEGSVMIDQRCLIS